MFKIYRRPWRECVTVQDIDTWDTDLSALTDGLRWLFTRPEPTETFGMFVRAMLADVAKKNCWAMAEYAGLANGHGTPQDDLTARPEL